MRDSSALSLLLWVINVSELLFYCRYAMYYIISVSLMIIHKPKSYLRFFLKSCLRVLSRRQNVFSFVAGKRFMLGKLLWMFGSDDRCYDGVGHGRERKTLSTRDWHLVSSDSPWLSRPDWTQRFWSPERLKPRGFRAGLWILSYMPLTLPYVTNLSSLFDCWEIEPRQAAPPKRSGYCGVFYIRRTSVHECVWRCPRRLRYHT